jgi:hypothetical protein
VKDCHDEQYSSLQRSPSVLARAGTRVRRQTESGIVGVGDQTYNWVGWF